MVFSFREWMHDGSQSDNIPFWAITLLGYESNPTMRFYGDGRLTTPKGDVAFKSDLTSASVSTYSDAYNTPGSVTITRTPDSGVPTGTRIRMMGETAHHWEGPYLHDTIITIQYPVELSGILPGAYGTTFVADAVGGHDTYNMMYTAPTLTSMSVILSGGGDDINMSPGYFTWWIEGW